ncbi:MAG: DUF3005 domain-containing protein [Janthinobacterium lividum]
MNTNEQNPSREAQHEQAAQSPLKKPETETAHANAADVADAADAQQDTGNAPQSGNQSTARGRDARASGESDNQRPVPDLDTLRPREQGVTNDQSLDDTVDTDAKDRDAKRPQFGSDNVINSDASLSRHVETPDVGLAGIDSRPTGNLPQIVAKPGSAVIDEGVVEDVRLYGTAGSAEELPLNGAPGGADDRTVYPANHVRAGHIVKIVPKNK